MQRSFLFFFFTALSVVLVTAVVLVLNDSESDHDSSVLLTRNNPVVNAGSGESPLENPHLPTTNLLTNSSSTTTKSGPKQNKATPPQSKTALAQKTKTKRPSTHRQVFQTKHIDESRLSHSTLLITGKVENPNSTERFKAVHPSYLKGVDAINREALYTWLAEGDPETRGNLGENALRNNLLKSLIELGKDPARLQDLMTSMLEDNSADPIWRDYVLQHLPIFEAVHLNQAPSHSTNFVTSSLYSTPAIPPTHEGVQKNSHRPNTSSTAQTPKNLDTKIFAELSEYYSADPKLAGTALIAWNLILEQSNEPKNKLLDAAWKVASSADFSIPSRSTALQTLAQNHDLRALNLASQLFREAKAFNLKLSAISVLGQLGGENELDLLANLPDSKYQKIAMAKAVQKINKRLNI